MSAATRTRRDVARLASWLGLLSLPALAAPGAIARASALAPDALRSNPWFVTSHAGLLYGLVKIGRAHV